MVGVGARFGLILQAVNPQVVVCPAVDTRYNYIPAYLQPQGSGSLD